MRILFVLHQFFPEFSGGTERVTLNLARMAQHAGHHVKILACTVDPQKTGGLATDVPLQGTMELTYQGVAVTLIPKSLLPATSDIGMDADETVVNNLVTWIRDGQFDVAHVLHTMRMGSALLALQQCGVPYVLSLTDFYLPCARINLITLRSKSCPGPDGGRRCDHDCRTAPWSAQAYASRFVQAQAIMKAAGARVAPSEYVADRYRDIFPEEDIRVIPHGIDLLAMGIAERRAAPQAQADVLRMVYAGAIIPQKGLDVLLRAMALIPQAPISLKVIGGLYGEPDYHRDIEALVKLDNRVEMAGVLGTQQVFQAMSDASLLCLPSLVPESFSLAFHESAAAGIPAIVSDLGAPSQYVLAHNCGAVAKAGDPQVWAKAITSILDAPDTLKTWKKNLFLPLRIEEEAFFFESIYQQLRCE